MEDASQEEVFKEIEPLIHQVMRGQTAVIIAYG
jgi:hypothetical protein